MNFQTATPAQIDTDWARISAEISKAAADINHLVSTIERYSDSGSSYYINRIPELREKLAAAEAAERAASAKLAPHRAEWAARGGWTRYFLVDNANGHVHPSTSCSTCFPTTQYAWLTEQSGLTAAELVELAGEKACTVCFPWAPVDVLSRSTKLEAPERKAARLEREKAAAARAARKAKNAIPETLVYTQGDRHPEKLTTLTAAKGRLTDHIQYVEVFGWKEFITGGMDDLVQAIATKEDKTAEQVMTEARKRAAKR